MSSMILYCISQQYITFSFDYKEFNFIFFPKNYLDKQFSSAYFIASMKYQIVLIFMMYEPRAYDFVMVTRFEVERGNSCEIFAK